MTTPDTTFHLMGLIGSGKTNFLVAFDVILDHPADEHGLVHDGSADDRNYLAPLRQAWFRGEVFERTSRQAPPPPHQLLVKHTPTGTRVGFNLPDLAGETIESFFVTRSIPHDLWEKLKKAEGILLFVHCDHNADHEILSDPALMEPVTASQSGNSPTRTEDAAEVGAEPKWNPESAAMQVKLVDLLQFIAEGGPRSKPLRVAVMISAWELVEKLHKNGSAKSAAVPTDPVSYLAKYWPLLHQFFESNEDIFCYRVFGASARGGGNDEAEIKRLTSIDQPNERVLLIDDQHRSTDLTRPVRWLLGLLEPHTTSNA